MKVLVTGATGFIGRFLMARLAAAGHEAVPVTRARQPGSIPWDFCAGSPVPALPRDASAIVHLAQSRAYRRFPEDAAEMFAVNVAATQALLDAALAAGIPRFCLISSGAVYEPFDGPMHEDAPLAPGNFLGASKLAAEIVARPYGALLSLAALRLFFPYGPGQSGRLIPEIVRRVSNGMAVDVGPDGEGLNLTPTHVEDICDAILACIETPWTGTINVAAPEVLSIAEIGRQVGEALDRPVTFNRRLAPATPIVPDLSRFSELHALCRMRSFREGVRGMAVASAAAQLS